MRKLIISAFITLLACSATIAAVKPPELNTLIKAHSPHGRGTLSAFVFDVYDAELWSDAVAWSYESPFALTLVYKMSFTSDELTDRTFEEIEREHGKNGDREKFGAALAMAFPNVQKGDRITAYFQPTKGLRFYHNGTPTGTVEDIDFSKRFIDIWLAETTSEPSLRKKLVGG